MTLLKMRTPIAWFNTVQHKRWTLVASLGICFSVLLIFMQLGFLGGARQNASFLYRALEGDIILVPKGYFTIGLGASNFSGHRIFQARNLSGGEGEGEFAGFFSRLFHLKTSSSWTIFASITIPRSLNSLSHVGPCKIPSTLQPRFQPH